MKRTTSGVFVVGLVLALFLCLVTTPSVRGQSTTDGAIGGTVTDPSGAAVVNAHVTVRSNGTNVEQSATTDETGYYRVTKLQPGSYTVSVELAGFASFKAEQVTVQVGSVTELAELVFPPQSARGRRPRGSRQCKARWPHGCLPMPRTVSPWLIHPGKAGALTT